MTIWKRMAVWAIFMGLLGGLSGGLTAQAKDTLHFYNGHVLRGDVEHVVGDLIKFQDALGKTAYIKRLQLTNRQDVIQTWANQKYLGEVIYMDDSKTEIRTPTGTHTVWNIWVKNMVMGSPSAFAEGGYIESPSQLMPGFENLRTPKSPAYTAPTGYNYSSQAAPAESSAPSLPSEYTGGGYDKPMVRFPEHRRTPGFE